MLSVSVFLNLCSFLIIGCGYDRISVRMVRLIACTFSLLAVISTMCLFYPVIILGEIRQVHLVDWISIDALKLSWSLHLDSLTFVMLMVVNAVSALVQIYSVGYMDDSVDNIPRYHAFVSLFSFFMLLLVTADNLLQLFVGWEGVGLCSYLLIGYWYKKNAASQAALKAFIVNRIADVFLILGLITIYLNFHTLSFIDIFAEVPYYADNPLVLFGHNFRLVDVVGILLFIGCMGKSAQILFHTWLPDAMEGPTPVSALIHAATMVTAGVFLVVKLSPIFEYSPISLDLITIIGAVTAVFAATIALVVDDIKKIVAYSTCSQLGYMFIACGVSAYPAAMFHLVTHAHFKALLFLAVGSVIHATGGEQNIQKMSGLRTKIPFTYFATLVGSLSLSGIFPFSGFFSKDVILEAAFLKNSMTSNFAYYAGMVGVVLTAFYSFRLVFKVFHGSLSKIKNVHESPNIMLIPMMWLVFAATFSGMLGEYWLDLMNHDLWFWRSSIYISAAHNMLGQLHDISFYIKYLPLVLSGVAIGFAAFFYLYRHDLRVKVRSMCAPLYKILEHKYYFDEFYELIFIRPFKSASMFVYQKLDIKYIDGCGPNGVARFVIRISRYVRSFQTGLVYNYAFAMVLSLIVLLTWYVIKFV